MNIKNLNFKIMKRYFLYLILLIIVIFAQVITSCNKSKDDMDIGMTVSGTLEFSERYNDIITKVQVDVYEGEYPVLKLVTLARGHYSNGTFSLELPARVEDKYLNQGLSSEDFEPYIKISDKEIKTRVFDFTATDFDEEIANSIDEKNKEGNGMWGYSYKTFPLVYIKYDDISNTEGLFFYADRDCSITGSITASDRHYTQTYSMHLKRGWNIVYHTEKYIETDDKHIRITEYSTEPVSGLKWYVRGDF